MSSSPFDLIAGQLRTLESKLRTWIERPHRWPLSYDRWLAFSKLADDVLRQAKALSSDRPHLIVMLMGGTGVGKSSLLNALARGTIAEAAFTRPTTREPIVYLHQAYPVDRLDQALRQCRIVRHDQAGLEHKIIVDTPDLDSNETIHRDRLHAVLPTADVVLYVGSQEKYHDQAGWEVFLQHRERRAFAFVLNKWDRCVAASGTGVRPDEDLLRDLRAAGFADPLLFRTCAHAWVSSNGKPPPSLPEGEQFQALAAWLEQGLTRREIEAIRTKGIHQLLTQLESALHEAQPPDVQGVADKTTTHWRRTVRDEIDVHTELVLNCVAAHQKTLERRLGQSIKPPFRGVMGAFTRMLDLLRHGIFRSRLPRLTSGPGEIGMASADLVGFARSCAKETFTRSLSARLTALTDRLVANADDAGLPTSGLAEDITSQLRSITDETYANYLGESLRSAETVLAGESSWRQRSSRVWTWLGDLLPWATALVTLIWLVYAKFFTNAFVGVMDLLLMPFVAAFFVMIVLYAVYRWTVPVTWRKIVPVCSSHIRQHLRESFETALQSLPAQQAALLMEERRAVAEVLQLTGEARELMRRQEQLGEVAVLYAQ
jgi:hypothetical protein